MPEPISSIVNAVIPGLFRLLWSRLKLLLASENSPQKCGDWQYRWRFRELDSLRDFRSHHHVVSFKKFFWHQEDTTEYIFRVECPECRTSAEVYHKRTWTERPKHRVRCTHCPWWKHQEVVIPGTWQAVRELVLQQHQKNGVGVKKRASGSSR